MNFVYALLAVGLLCAGAAPAAEILDPARVQQIAAMLPAQPVGLGRPIGDRAAWDKLAQDPALQRLLKRAEGLLTQPLPEQPDDLFLDFSRTGNRDHWQNVAYGRRARLMPLVMGECLENKGRFLPAIQQLIEAVCAERTWVMPAHDTTLANFNGKAKDIDLISSALAWELSTADWLLGDKLPPACRQMLRDNVNERVLTPYREMFTGARPPNWWILTTNNWNAVCLAGVTGAGLVEVSDRQGRAEFVAAAEKFSRNFLSGFTPDGYCSEGLGYWNYGFGNFVWLSETIRQATDGKLDLLLLPQVKAPAMFGASIEVINHVYPAIADCGVNAQPDTPLMWFVNRRLQLGLSGYSELPPGAGLGGLSQAMIFSFPNGASAAPVPPPAHQSLVRSWFNDAGILITRPVPGAATRLAAALKGGNNNEHHNHNDVGSYTVVAGTRAPLLDPGGEVYTARTFSSHRYDSKLLNSFGHPVPLVAGQMQKEGADAKAVITKTDFTDSADTLQMDIKSAYPVPDLKALDRTFVYSRAGAGSLQVTDRVEFAAPQAFETALIARSGWKALEHGKLMIYDGDQALEVTIKATGGEYEIKSEVIREDAPIKPTRLAIAFTQPVTAATVEVSIKPADLPDTGSGLLKNGGFEYGSFYWDIPGDGFAQISTEQAAEGTNSLKITDAKTDGGSNVTSMPMPAKADKSYVLSGQAFVVSGKGIGMYVKYSNDRGEQLNPSDGKGNIAPVGSIETGPAKWEPFSYKFKTPPGTTKMTIWIHSYGGAQVEAYLDDLKVVEE